MAISMKDCSNNVLVGLITGYYGTLNWIRHARSQGHKAEIIAIYPKKLVDFRACNMYKLKITLHTEEI